MTFPVLNKATARLFAACQPEISAPRQNEIKPDGKHTKGLSGSYSNIFLRDPIASSQFPNAHASMALFISLVGSSAVGSASTSLKYREAALRWPPCKYTRAIAESNAGDPFPFSQSGSRRRAAAVMSCSKSQKKSQIRCRKLCLYLHLNQL